MKRNIVIATVAAAALIGGGTVAAYAAAGDDDGAATQRQSSVRISDDRDDSADDAAEDRADDRDDDSVEVRSDAAGAKVTAADAIAAALKHTPGTAVGADLDDDGSRAWEVSVVKGDGTE
ncbi:PepSY domain-containing protein, partial [Streptomyces chartreusis]|uniref:PepSY domain-containing protein n=1 Tax=Streptomyces chartreusis TaxID=1969 RepID=UPI0036AF6C0F